jgi:hypothetical protein
MYSICYGRIAVEKAVATGAAPSAHPTAPAPAFASVWTFRGPGRTAARTSLYSPVHITSCARDQRSGCPQMASPPHARRARGPRQLVQDAQEAYKTKPGWCQPSTIALTGTIACAGSLAVFRGPFLPLAVLVNGAVFLWWWTFLVLFPAAVLESRSGGSD